MRYLSLIVPIVGIALWEQSCKNSTTPQLNILFILADDWSYLFASIYGDSVVRTPNLERLAEFRWWANQSLYDG